MTNLRHFSAGVVALLFVPWLRLAAQEDFSKSRLFALRKNAQSLNVVVKLDRSEYLAGEDPEVTLSVSNPTVWPLEVPDPFHVENAGIDLQAKDPANRAKYGTDWWYLAPHPFALSRPTASERAQSAKPIPAIVLSASQQVERRVRLSDMRLGREAPIYVEGRLPVKPGEYRVQYGGSVKQATAEFRVLPSILEAMTAVTLLRPDQMRSVRTGKLHDMPRRVYVSVVGSGGAHFVMVSLWASSGVTRPQDYPIGRPLADPPTPLAPFVRVAESARPIASIRGSADAAENIILDWADVDGRRFSVTVDKDRRVVGRP
jgi:hypothetical protein